MTERETLIAFHDLAAAANKVADNISEPGLPYESHGLSVRSLGGAVTLAGEGLFATAESIGDLAVATDCVAEALLEIARAIDRAPSDRAGVLERTPCHENSKEANMGNQDGLPGL